MRIASFVPRKARHRALWSLVALGVCLAGVNLSAALRLSKSSISFGSQALGTVSETRTVVLRTTTALQYSLTVTGDFAVEDPCGGVLAAGGACTISVRFLPTALGARTGVLAVTDVAAPGNTASVNLAGTGLVPTVLNQTSLAFGNVATNATSAPKTVRLSSNLDVPLTGIVVTTSNPDYAATGCPTELPAGGTCTLSVTFAPTSAPGTLEDATLTIAHSAVNSPQSVALSGTSVLPFSLSGAALAFSPTLHGQSELLTLTLTNNQSARLDPPTLTTLAPFSVTGCATSVAGGGTCTIRVRFSPTPPQAGPTAGALTVATSVGSYSVNVALSGVAVPILTLVPNPLAFGGVTVASTSTPQVVTVTNNRSTSVRFAATPRIVTGPASADFTVQSTTCGPTLASAASCTISITFQPTIGGQRAATLEVHSNALGSPHTVALSGIGTTPLTVSPPHLAFGSVDVGVASGPQLVTVHNNQSIPAAFGAMSATGDFAAGVVGTTCGAVLGAGQTCGIAVAMSPAIAGPRTGSLVINSDTTESPNTVGLSGDGTNGVTASTTSLTFASQAVGTTSSAQSVVLTNHQTVPASLGTMVTGDFAAANTCGDTLAALSSCAVTVTFSPTEVGTRTGTAAFNNPGSAPTVVSLTGTGTSSGPQAAIASVEPGAGTRGTTVTGVLVTGNGHTHFAATSLVSVGDGVVVSNIAVQSPGTLTADLSIAVDAIPGPRTVTVITVIDSEHTETASLTAGFVVSASTDRPIASLTPDQAAQGQTLDVAIVGTNTHFHSGTTFANFGDGILVNSLTIQDQTHAVANVTVSPTTALGWRTVMLVTGGEIATIAPIGEHGPGFRVVAGPATLASVSPSSGAQGGTPFVVTVTGDQTHFLQGATVVSLGAGINVGNVTVIGPTELTASIAITGGATAGFRDVTTITGGEVATLPQGFEVTPAPPAMLSSVTPSSGAQGETLTVTLVGVSTHFTTDLPPPSLTLGSNITIEPLTIVDDTTITAGLSIDAIAHVGDRQGILSSGGTNFPFTFAVLASGAAIAAVQPATVGQGAVATIAVTGRDTHWLQGTTTATFTGPAGCVAPTANTVTIDSPTSAVLLVTVPATTCVSQYTLHMATGGEVLLASLGVYARTPSLAIAPASAMRGTAVTVNLVGEFTHFGAATTAVIDGTGISLDNVLVTSASGVTARLAIDAEALAGLRTITLTSPLGDGAFEVVTAAFSVTTTPAVLTTIEPFHLAPGESATVTIRGAFTHFGATTTVGFGPDITVGPPTVVGETELSVEVMVDAAAAAGWRQVFINTGDEQLVIGFRVDGPEAPSLSLVSPSSAVQGQSLTVAITGVRTSFNTSSQLILGAGVTVSDFQVTSPTTATAVVAVSPTAPLGPNTVIVQTTTAPGQLEIVSGAGFTVLGGPSQILSVAPNIGAQGQVLNVAIVGQATHWFQGATTADFGAGVTVADLTIADATHATAQIVVHSAAAPGFRQVTLFTDGEYAFIGQGLDIQQGTPTLVSSSPNTGAQGTTFSVQVLGSLTHWAPGLSSASYGPGVTVNSFTVLDSVSGVLSVTIDSLAFPTIPQACHALTITTGTEQVTLANQLCLQAGAAVVTAISPNAAPQGSTLTVTVTGQNSHFAAGLTTADFGHGINTSNVTVASPTTATVDVAVTTGAVPGLRTVTLTTLGESASLAQAFDVGPNTPTLNAASPFSAQPGQSLTVRVFGQYTHWLQGATTVVFGQGITVTGVSVVDATTADVSIVVDALATLGGRMVSVTTGGEIVSAQVFGVVAGGAIISQVAPQSGNQGQEIVLDVTGQNTHWQQGFTQFAMAGAGGDIQLNYVLINSETSATVGLTIAPFATPGPRSIYLVTGAEAVVSTNAFVVTGGVPAIASMSPGSARPGDTGVTVQVTGLYTTWLTGTTTVDFGPGITVTGLTVNNDTSLTAVLSINGAAGLGRRTPVVRNSTQGETQALTGIFDVVSPVPPPAVIQYLSPSSGLRGQTFTMQIGGANTHFDPTPNATTIDFGDPGTSGIQINSFQVTSPTSARVNITIAADAAFGSRTLSVVSHLPQGDEVVQALFGVIQATPVLSIVDPSSGMQGATITVNLVGQYTGFNDTTVFNFGPGVTVEQVDVLGATVAQARLAIGQLAPLGFRFVTATTGAEVVTAGFTVTPSTAVIVFVAPNTALQAQSVAVEVTGQNTHWDGSTLFSFGPGLDVSDVLVDSPIHATMHVSVAALAATGARPVTATTGGEIATLAYAFVVQPGTPLILSSGPAFAQQQAAVTLTILGQATAWDGTTTVDLGAGIAVQSVVATSATALTVDALVDPLTTPGHRTLTVTTGTHVLTLPNALVVTTGPAAIALLTPSHAGQGETLDVLVTGVNTHFVQGDTGASFGDGILVNAVTVQNETLAIVNLSVAAGAGVGQRTATLTTLGETASIVNGFTVVQTLPFLQFVTPSSAPQGQTLDVTVVGSITNFTAPTTFDFGPGIVVNGYTAQSATNATVNLSVSSVAARTTRAVSATTGGVTATGANLFTVTAGPAVITAIAPNQGALGQAGLQVTISGFLTHFTAGPPTVDLGPGVTVGQIVVDSDTQLRATISVDPLAPVQFNDVVVTTLGEVAVLDDGFAVVRPFVTSVAPSSAYQEQTLDVVVAGVHTHFVQGTTTASFGAGIVVNSVTVTSATVATVNLTVQVSAVPGVRTITLTTGLESASGPSLFTVLEKETPIITWSAPAGIVYGTPLGPAELNAQANVTGTFVYTPQAGTILHAGVWQTLSVVFTPDDTVRYFDANASVLIAVDRAPQEVLIVTGAPASGVYLTSFTVSTSGGSGSGAVTFAVTGSCSNVGGGALVTMTSGTGSCAITATKAGDDNYLATGSAVVVVTAEKAAQATLVVTGAPATSANGTSFTVGAAGGSGTGAITFTATGACSNVDALVTMTSSTGVCAIIATRAADANYHQVVSAAALVGASGPVPPVFDVVPTTAFLSVPASGTAFPGVVSVRLTANGAPVAAPPGGLVVNAVSDNPACVVATSGGIAGGAYTGSIGVAYGTATPPCTATITASTDVYGGDTVTVAVYPYADAPVTSAATAVAYFNPAPVPNPVGAVNTRVAAVSYYNPAPIPSPTGGVTASVASLSYYNPAPVPSPGGSVNSSSAAVSYFNPATIPTPTGGVAASSAAVSYYNPAPLPGSGGTVWASVAAVSYQNGAEAGLTATDLVEKDAPTAAPPAIDASDTSAVISVSIANGPTASTVRPLRLSRRVGGPYTVRIDGANLTGATGVAFEGLDPHVTVDPLVVSDDGRRVTVVVWIAPDAPLGPSSVVVSGAGWRTPDVPGMRVEIVP